MSACVRIVFTSAAASLLLLHAAGCGGSGKTTDPAAEMTLGEVNSATRFVAAPRTSCDELVKSIEAAVAHQDIDAFNALIDEEQIVDRILAGLDAGDTFRTSFMQGMREGGGLANLSREIMGSVQRGGDYIFVRMVQSGDEIHPLFRLSLPESGGMNYHELIISIDAEKRPRIADIHVYLSGELLSQSIRRLVLPAVAAENAGIMAKLTGAESAFLKHVGTMQKINDLSRSQQYAEALALFQTLPESLQKDKTVLMTRLIVAQGAGEAEYTSVIRDLEKYYPNDPARDFRAMDLLAMQGQHDNLIKTVDRLIASIQDPYLNLLKVNSLLELNRIDEAHKAVADAKAASPDRVDIYWTETSIALKEKNHAATAALLDEISEKFGMTFNDLNQISEYANFAQSEIGKEWIARHAAESSIAEPAVPSETTAPVDETPVNETPANEAPVNDAPATDAAPVVPEQ